MQTAGEVVHHMNETGECIYELSKLHRFSRSTLYERLKRLEYSINQEGKWIYSGDPAKDPSDVDIITKKRMATPKALSSTPRKVSAKGNLNIHQALMNMNIQGDIVRTTVSFEAEYKDKMKELSIETRLRLSDLYTLAIYEFLKKYHSPK